MSARVLLFDLDGTLVDSARDIAIALNRLRAERGAGPLALAEVRPLVGLGADALVGQGLGAAGRDPAADIARLRTYIGEVPVDRAAIYPGVPGALDRLTQAGWRMAIVTNKPERLARDLLAGLGLAHFEAIVGGDSAGEPKPSPAPVRLALSLLGEAAALFVGDSAIDAAAARASGLPFLLFTGGCGAADCRPEDVCARFAHFDALPDLVAAEGSIHSF